MGWYGFNCVSTLYIDGYAQSAAHVAMTTTLGAAAGCLTTAAIGYVEKQYIDPGYVYNGVLAGLVGITSPCAVVSPWGAIIVGAIGAFVYVGASKGVKAAGIDDAVDAFAVHGACGFWGVVAVGLFASPDYGYNAEGAAGLFYGGELAGVLLGVQLAGLMAQIAWVTVMSLILFFALKAARILRVDAATEEEGMDVSKHGGLAYVSETPKAAA